MQMTTLYFGHAHSTQGPLQFLAEARAQYSAPAPVPLNTESAEPFDPEATLPVNVTFIDPKSASGRLGQAQSTVMTIGLLEPGNPFKAHIPPPEPEVVPLVPTPHSLPPTSTPADVPPEVIEPPMPGEHVPVLDPVQPGQPLIASE